jgi:hypothetical protein
MNLITFKNPSILAWLEAKGITGERREYVTPNDIAHRHVYGHLPLWLAAYTERISEVSMPRLSREARQRLNDGQLTVAEMDAAGAYIATYQVRNAG